MTVRRTQALDVPAAELERMKEALSPRYGAQMWDPEGHALLVVRVPRDEPDLVNDLEGAVEYLSPSDVRAAKVTLFVGHRRSHIVPTPALQSLMEARVALDHAQAEQVRRFLKPGEHQVFQAPDDPRRLRRLALRLPAAKVADLADTHLAPFVEALGPQLRSPALAHVRAVHLVADGDDVRLDADLFFQDLEERWREERERRALAQALAVRQAAVAEATAAKAQGEVPRAAVTKEGLPRPLPASPPVTRTALAPLRRADSPAWEATTEVPNKEPLALPPPPTDGMGEVFEVGPVAPPAASSQAGLEGELSPRPEDGLAPPGLPQGEEVPTAIALLDARLQALGFATLPRPGRHGIDLAAERQEGHPGRVIAFAPGLLDTSLADRVLGVARTVDADQALIVCDRAEPEARRRLIATRAKWLTAAEIPHLKL
ncbi:MAG TPA: hypothetical protein VHI93_03320 [Candidatus Thermoplasmatota archaeon]|nr:hypothetical protein [Candidatus Thermoplasmatota archaeon]